MTMDTSASQKSTWTQCHHLPIWSVGRPCQQRHRRRDPRQLASGSPKRFGKWVIWCNRLFFAYCTRNSLSIPENCWNTEPTSVLDSSQLRLRSRQDVIVLVNPRRWVKSKKSCYTDRSPTEWWGCFVCPQTFFNRKRLTLLLQVC